MRSLALNRVQRLPFIGVINFLHFLSFLETQEGISVVPDFGKVLGLSVPEEGNVDTDSAFLHVPEEVEGVLDVGGVKEELFEDLVGLASGADGVFEVVFKCGKFHLKVQIFNFYN